MVLDLTKQFNALISGVLPNHPYFNLANDNESDLVDIICLDFRKAVDKVPQQRLRTELRGQGSS